MNEILKQAAYLWMSVAKILATNDVCEQRMHCAHMQRLKKTIDAKLKKINVFVNVRTCVSNNGQSDAVSKCRFKPMNALAFE